MAWTVTQKFVYPADWGAAASTTPTRRIRVQIMGTSDAASDLAAQVALTLTGVKGMLGDAATRYSIEHLEYTVSGLNSLDILYDRAAATLVHRATNGWNAVKFDPPLRDVGTGGTGNIVLNTTGGAATSRFTLDMQVLVHP